MTRLIPRTDAEENVIAYMEREIPLKRVLKRFASRNSKRMMEMIAAILERAGYDGTNKATALIRQADPSTIRDLERLAQSLPDKDRERMMTKLYGQIGTGSLTVRKAVNDVIRYGPRVDADKLHIEARSVLRDTATEAFMRGEFMVQKSVGIGWQMEVPGEREVDVFLKNRWTEQDATQYLKPLSQAVRDQVETGLYLGEHPNKIAKRIQEVENINEVRAKRNARTITTAVSNQAQMEQYRKDGIEKYRFRATFDERTCPVCGDLDGQEFRLDERSSSNYPPIHPNCRCTTVAVLSKKAEAHIQSIVEAHARKDGRTDYVSPNSHFNDWKRAHT